MFEITIEDTMNAQNREEIHPELEISQRELQELESIKVDSELEISEKELQRGLLLHDFWA